MDVDVPGDGGSNRRVANHNYFLRKGQENYYFGQFLGGRQRQKNFLGEGKKTQIWGTAAYVLCIPQNDSCFVRILGKRTNFGGRCDMSPYPPWPRAWAVPQHLEGYFTFHISHTHSCVLSKLVGVISQCSKQSKSCSVTKSRLHNHATEGLS